jgi:hypothetical protein
MSGAGGPGKGPTASVMQLKNTTSAKAVQGDNVLIAKYGKGYRWWPSPESRKRGSQRWVVPAVEQWHPAASIAEVSATFMARDSTL